MEIPIEPPCTPTPFPFIHMWSWAIIFGHKLRDLALSHESWCGAHTLPCSLTHAKTHTCIQFFSFTYTLSLSLSLSLCLHIHTLSLIRSSCTYTYTLSVCEAPYLGIYSHTLSLSLCHSIKHLERDQSINDVSIQCNYKHNKIFRTGEGWNASKNIMNLWNDWLSQKGNTGFNSIIFQLSLRTVT